MKKSTIAAVLSIKKNSILNLCLTDSYIHCRIKNIYTVLLFWTTSSILLLAQAPNIGIPTVFNYEKTTYHGGTQSWESSILENGNMVFANNDGLLVFNGSAWKTHRLPKKTICRSLSISKDSRIYVGGQDEVGFFAPRENGELSFTSIRERIQKKALPIDDVWNFVSEEKNQYFRSNEKIFFDNRKDSIYSIASYPTITNLSKVDGIIYFAVLNEGLFKVQNGVVSKCINSNIPDITITSICSHANGLLIGTLKSGLFHYSDATIKPLHTDYQSFLIESRILQVYKTNLNKVIIATERNGLIVANSSLQAIHHINKIKGLQNNIVRTVHEDHAGSIWVGTGNGIDQILLQDGTQVFYPDGEEQGSIYDIIDFKGRYYFATGNGLYFIEKKDQYNPFLKGNFQLVKNSLGQVWGVDTIDGQLLMGHVEGAFMIQDGMAVQISPTNSGTWKFEKLNDSILVAGTYFGLDFYAKRNDKLEFIGNSKGFKESARIIEIDRKKQIWVSHPYRGVYKITANPDLHLEIVKYGKKQGLYSDFLNFVFQYQDEIIVTSEVGVYRFKENIDSFILKQEWTSKLGPKTNVRRLFPLDENLVVYSTATHIGKLIQSPQIGDPAIFLQQWTQHSESLVKGFEFIYPMNKETFFLATDKGVIIHSLANKKSEDALSVHFNNIKIAHDTITELYSGYGNLQQDLKLDPDKNTIQFTYSANMINPYQPTEYRFWLEGIESNWSSWSVDQYKDYTRLRTGRYTFHVQARNATHGQSEIYSYSFAIKPHWYESKLAFILYSIFAIVGLLAFSIFIKKRYRNEAIILKEEQKLSQAEIQRLKNDKLETELQFRNKELASSTMHLVQKNETITKIKQELDSIYQKVKDTKIRRELRKVITVINDNDRLEGEWENFAIYFDQVHTNFLKRLSKKFPELSSKDLKLAAYLRMNLTTKEIAPLLNISIRGVEISRYRLRKKLGLKTEINLNEYMMNF